MTGILLCYLFSLIKTLLNFILLGFWGFCFVFHEISSPVLSKGETRRVFPTSLLLCSQSDFLGSSLPLCGTVYGAIGSFLPGHFLSSPTLSHPAQLGLLSSVQPPVLEESFGLLDSRVQEAPVASASPHRIVSTLPISRLPHWLGGLLSSLRELLFSDRQRPVSFPVLPPRGCGSYENLTVVSSLPFPGQYRGSGSLACCGCSLKAGLLYSSCCHSGEIFEQCHRCHHLLGIFSPKFVFFQFKLIIAQGLLKNTMNRGYQSQEVKHQRSWNCSSAKHGRCRCVRICVYTHPCFLHPTSNRGIQYRYWTSMKYFVLRKNYAVKTV